MHVVIFEGNQWPQFAPLSLSKPVFQLCCGIGTLLQKQIRSTQPTRLTLWVRPGLEAYCRQYIVPHLPCPTEVNVPLDDEPALLISGRTLHLTRFEHEDASYAVVDDSPTGPVIRQAKTIDPGLAPTDLFNRTPRWLALLDLPHSMPQSRLPQYIWDLISWNEEAIVTDFIDHHDPSHAKPVGPYHMLEEPNIWLGEHVKLGPGCVLDGSKGPVILADHVTIGANAVLEGPCYVGPHTRISPLANIRSGVSIGPMCKIGGEVFNSIILNYTNKPHDGFLGDSYVGEWVNLGAGSTAGNLKNTYGQINVSLMGKTIDTGKKFMGSFIGDHSKIGIGTRLMAGTYVGYSCAIACTHAPPKVVPSYSFLTDKGLEPYRMDKASGTMREAFNRRERNWTPTDEAMNQFVLEQARMIEISGMDVPPMLKNS